MDESNSDDDVGLVTGNANGHHRGPWHELALAWAARGGTKRMAVMLRCDFGYKFVLPLSNIVNVFSRRKVLGLELLANSRTDLDWTEDGASPPRGVQSWLQFLVPMPTLNQIFY